MTLLLDLAFILKVRKPVTDRGLEKTQTQSSQKEMSLITETTGSNIKHCLLYIMHIILVINFDHD